MILPRRSFLIGLASLITAPAVVRAEALMPICVWRPTFDLRGGHHNAPLLIHCRKDDLIGVDLASLGLPAPIDDKGGFGPKTNGPDCYWRYDRFPLASLPRDKVHIPLPLRLALGL
jgi:hypothetical protein